jgi:hypothetical protein
MWRGVITITPIAFTQILSNQAFNNFAIYFGYVMLLSTLISFGQSQYCYTNVKKHAKNIGYVLYNVNSLMIMIAAAFLFFCAAYLIPNKLSSNGIFFVAAITLSAILFSIIDIAITELIVVDKIKNAAKLYLILTACLVACVVPAVLMHNPSLMLALAIPGGLASIFIISKSNLFNFSFAELIHRFKFGIVQFVISIISASIPFFLQIYISTNESYLAGSKMLTIFTSTSGVFLFLISSLLVSRSREIAARDFKSASLALKKFSRKAALITLYLIPISILIQYVLLSSISPIFAIFVWLFVVSQSIIIFSRYMIFSNANFFIDLFSNVIPLILTFSFFLLFLKFNVIEFDENSPIAFFVVFNLLSALIYYKSISLGFIFRRNINGG